MIAGPSSPYLPLPLDARQMKEAQMIRFKFLLFAAVLNGFAALAYGGCDDGKAAYDRGDSVKACE